MGPFKLVISKTAEKLDFNALDEAHQQILCDGIAFDPEQFELFRFAVFPMWLPGKPKSKRWRRRKSFAKADHVMVHVEPGSPRVRFRGIYPRAVSATGERSREYEVEAILEIGIPKAGHLKLRGKTKSTAKNQQPGVMAAYTSKFAQWVFFEARLRQDPNFQMEILCALPKDLPESERWLRCRALVSDHGRELDSKKQKIALG